jgi:hypothetical protein
MSIRYGTYLPSANIGIAATCHTRERKTRGKEKKVAILAVLADGRRGGWQETEASGPKISRTAKNLY